MNNIQKPDERPPIRPLEGWIFVAFVVVPWAVIALFVVCARGCAA